MKSLFERLSVLFCSVILLFMAVLCLSYSGVQADDSLKEWNDCQDDNFSEYSEVESSELINRVFDYFYSRSCYDLSMLNYRLQRNLFTRYEECLPEFAELVSRKDFCSALLNAYRESGFGEYEAECFVNESVLTTDRTVYYELFLIELICYYHYDFSADEKVEYYEIREEKQLVYEPISSSMREAYFNPDTSSDERPVFNTIQEMRDFWYVKNDYPITRSDKEWSLYSLEEKFEILTPPDDMLSSFSSERLVELIHDWPLMTAAYNYTQTPFDEYSYNICDKFLREHCAAYSEMMKRDDRFDILLDLLEQNGTPPAYELVQFKPEYYIDYICYWLIKDYWSDMSRQEKNRYREILENKLKNGEGFVNYRGEGSYIRFLKPFFPPDESEVDDSEETGVLENISDTILSIDNSVENYSEITNDNVTRSYHPGFVGFGEYEYRERGNTTVNGEVGNYGKYGEEAETYKYLSGEFSASEVDEIDQDFEEIWDTWERVSSASARYNCHSYVWIMRPHSNIYWLDYPEDFFSGTGITYRGDSNDINPPSLQNGDYIVIYDSYDGSLHHSAIVSSAGNNADNTIVISKNGHKGVYRCTLQECFWQYASSSYLVFSPP